jgi:hypothetical protein
MTIGVPPFSKPWMKMLIMLQFVNGGYWSGRLAIHGEIALKIIPMILSSIEITINKSMTAAQ